VKTTRVVFPLELFYRRVIAKPPSFGSVHSKFLEHRITAVATQGEDGSQTILAAFF